VAIIGAGAGGLAMGVGLRRLGVGEFTIFEQQSGIGGTWWDNVYPGAEVDTPQPLYSFSFASFDFSRTHIKQAELQMYLETTAARFGLTSHIRFNTAVTRAVWDESTHTWEVFTSDGRSAPFEVVVSSVGLLNHPSYPDWPGLDQFEGEKWHSARWPQDADLKGKKVAVVGTGSTSAQLVPAIAPDVAQLYVFQRQPGWLMPKLERDLTPEERAQMLQPLHRRKVRMQQWWQYEKGLGRALVEGTKANIKAQQACVAYIEKVLADRPDLIKMVTPDYPFGGKRVVKDSNFYPTLMEDHVELVPHAVAEVTRSGIIDDTGVEREIDVLVMCTGFTPATFLATLEVVGRNGVSLHDFWGGDCRAYLGLTVSGFPNYYMLYGPNTNMVGMLMHERQVRFVSSNLKRMIRTGVTAIEVRRSVMDAFDWYLQRQLSHTVVDRHPEVHNYGRAPSGRNVIAWGQGMSAYSLLTRTTARISSRARRVNNGSP
jgi:cation diffusion facilitator CzcD-associated flavoprotein CzcO